WWRPTGEPDSRHCVGPGHQHQQAPLQARTGPASRHHRRRATDPSFEPRPGRSQDQQTDPRAHAPVGKWQEGSHCHRLWRADGPRIGLQMARNPAPAAEPIASGSRDSDYAPGEKSRLHQRYMRDVVPALVQDFNYQNLMEVPRVAKVSVNVGVGEAISNAKALDATVRDVGIITGQKPVVKKARKSIAQFKLREGQQVGVMVTLRGERMWEFLVRLMNSALTRTRHFRVVPARWSVA